ncbi:MAG TPA: amino acid adenylation domain-containing protein, partial [Longimicrobium sp.]|nr:amino acid adenylation domain-containing protein [Longimicrobium sp.]
ELEIQYADFAAWQRGWLTDEALAGELAWWREALAGAPPLLEVPTDRPRPAVAGTRAGSRAFTLSAGASDALRALSRAEGATLFTTLLAGWQALLGRWSGQDDVVVGTPVAGRTRAEVEGLIGMFVNTLALRADLSGAPTFRALLRRARATVLDAQSRQELPFERLVDEMAAGRTLAHAPLVQALFSYRADAVGGVAPALAGIEVEPVPAGDPPARFDLSLTAWEAEGGRVGGVLTYRADLFDGGTAERMLRHYAALLETLAAAPDARPAEVSLVDDAERALLAAWNRTEAPFPDLCLHELVERQAAATPRAVAVEHGGRTTTYAELDAAANRLARRLAALGAGPEARVAVCVERSPEMLAAVLGVLKAGAAYVPLDPAHPAERMRMMLEDSGASLVVTRAAEAAGLPAHDLPVVLMDGSAGEDGSTDEDSPEGAPRTGARPGNAAYVIFTSGSTGRPKGVLVPHAAAVNLVVWQAEAFGTREGERVLQFAPLVFDASVPEIFTTLSRGGTLVMAPADELAPGPGLAALLRERAVDTAKLTPSALAALPDEEIPGLRLLIVGGEACPPELAARWSAGRRMLNVYGPTEAAVRCTMAELRPGAPVTLGRPLPNARVHVLDAALRPAPLGVPGELCVAGAGVARGYLGRPALTAEKFVPDPFSAEPGTRMYRTGDRARWTAGGEVEYLGRLDQQVKVRGVRVELGEVEAALAAHPAVRAAAAALHGAGGSARLAGYLVAAEGAELPAAAELREFLRARLPEAMVPAAFVALDALPLTASGKLDRRALPAPSLPAPSAAGAAPRAGVETVLARVWADVLRRDAVGAHDDFFEIGGDSILSIQVVARARAAGVRITPRQLFTHPTVAALARVAGAAGAPVAEQGAVSGPAPLTPIQHAFFARDVPARHHWNLPVLLAVRGRPDAGALDAAVHALAAHHDALRMRFARDASGGWTQRNAAAEEARLFGAVDLSGLDVADRGAARERASRQLQRGLSLERGPLFRAALLDDGEEGGARLLLAPHHLVADGVSLRVLLEDLAAAYGQASAGAPVSLPPKTTSFRHWAERLAAHAAAGGFAAERAYWTDPARRGVPALPVDFEGGADDGASARTVSFSLTAGETAALLHDLPAAYRTQVNDALLAALARALGAWTGEERVVVELEGHGREELFADVDTSRTVGWFTTLYPVLLELAGAEGPGGALKAVKEQLRAVPGRGIGHGALRWLASDDDAAALAEAAAPEIRFNYLGQFDAALPAGGAFAPAAEGTGPARDPRDARGHRFLVTAAVLDGRLSVSWTYGEGTHRRETVERLAGGYAAELRALAAHAREEEAGGYTPSDFPLAGLGQGELDRVLGRERGIEELYPLTPLQEG